MDKDIEEIIEKVMFELRDRIDGLMNDSYGNMYDEGVLDAIDIIKMDYCPTCGAKMEEDDDEQETEEKESEAPDDADHRGDLR